MNSGPVAQFRPMASRSACATETQKASAAWPASMVPMGSMVPETMTGTLQPSSRSSVLNAEQRRLHVARVLAGLDQQEVDAALHQRLGLLVVSFPKFGEGDAAGDRDGLGGGAHGAGDEARPRAVVTNSSAAWRARVAAARFSSYAWSASPYSASTIRVAPKVLVSTMSAPASR